MSFVINTDIYSAYLKGNGRVANRFVQHSGGLHISAVTAAELYTWAFRRSAGAARLNGLTDMLREVQSLPVNNPVAMRFGSLRAEMLDMGVVVETPDLPIASTALIYNFTMVTHNSSHFAHVPGLRLADWLQP